MSTATSIQSTQVGDSVSYGEFLTEQRSRTGLLVLIAALSSLFLLFILAFLIRSQYSDWQSLSAPWQPLANPIQLWFNTLLLVCSSGALVWARRAADGHQLLPLRQGLALATLFALAFLLGQSLVWRELNARGFGVAANPANSFFYLLTGLHALHLLGGLVGLLLSHTDAWRAKPDQRLFRRVRLCALYWHFLLAIWLLLLGLLTSSPENLQAFASLCGLR